MAGGSMAGSMAGGGSAVDMGAGWQTSGLRRPASGRAELNSVAQSKHSQRVQTVKK